jgi:hypothetical protein
MRSDNTVTESRIDFNKAVRTAFPGAVEGFQTVDGKKARVWQGIKLKDA